MSELRGGIDVKTFSAGFGDPRYDELPYARQVSKLLGTEHHEVVVGTEDFRSLWNKLTWHRDAPISEPADIAVFKLAELARRSVTVVLSGEGSDELFAGYPKHRYAGLSAAAGIVPSWVRSPLLGLIQNLAPPSASRLRIAARALSGRTSPSVSITGSPPSPPRNAADCCVMRHVTLHRTGCSSLKATPCGGC